MSLRCLSYYEQHFFLSNRIIQIVMGIGPDQSSNYQLFQCLTVTVYILPMILHQFYQLFMLDIKLQSTCNLLQKIISVLCITCTYCVFYFNFDTLQKLIGHIKIDYDMFSDQREIKIAERYTKQSKVYTIAIIGFCYICAISLTIPSISSIILHIYGSVDDVQLILPFPINNVLNAGPLYYSLLIYQILVIFIVLTIGSWCYSLYLILIRHACTQFTVLMFKIRQPFNEKKYKRKSWLSRIHKEEWKWIIDIIIRYARVTEYIDLINDFSKIICLFGAFVSMIIIFFDLLYIFQLPTIIHNRSKTFECFAIIFGSLFLIYNNFYIGQMVTDHSSAAFEELCQVPFYVLSIKTQKMLLFVIARSMRPCELSIGGIFVASNEIFGELMQKAFSFATVYYSMLQQK